ncbi:DUF2975 domain-containing protein [Clostridium tyrobutyricum]|uniref:DUF2975 domain-containing protein n=1 Tax=Clostridium tyrobutyricum TaxID=1519 RepID=UPI001C393E75|nr:DUF2975 domain-containing protein [Clostridium tyrobutyricum]MBV4446139.1 DUF2975 domain-containing protein [Clostridium tyrobutyricum]
MKQYSTIFLKIAVIVIGIPVLALGIYGLFDLYKYPLNPNNHELILYPIIIGIYVTVVPFYFALYQTFKILCYIDKSKAFSELSIKSLKYIKYCAITISIIYALIIPFVFPVADAEDAPGLVGFPIIFIFVASVVAVFSAVLQRLLQDAIDIKSENDLTV